jgi:hypothetical protein
MNGVNAKLAIDVAPELKYNSPAERVAMVGVPVIVGRLTPALVAKDSIELFNAAAIAAVGAVGAVPTSSNKL